MEPRFNISGRISKPVAEVFEAVADPEKLSGYFATGGASARLETGSTVHWSFHDHPEIDPFPVEIIEVIPNEKIVFKWEANDSGKDGNPVYLTTTTIEFDAIEPDRTLVTISESGWNETDSSVQAAFDNCSGWAQVLCALKVYIEHGINLREGFYK